MAEQSSIPSQILPETQRAGAHRVGQRGTTPTSVPGKWAEQSPEDPLDCPALPGESPSATHRVPEALPIRRLSCAAGEWQDQLGSGHVTQESAQLPASLCAEVTRIAKRTVKILEYLGHWARCAGWCGVQLLPGQGHPAQGDSGHRTGGPSVAQPWQKPAALLILHHRTCPQPALPSKHRVTGGGTAFNSPELPGRSWGKLEAPRGEVQLGQGWEGFGHRREGGSEVGEGGPRPQSGRTKEVQKQEQQWEWGVKGRWGREGHSGQARWVLGGEGREMSPHHCPLSACSELRHHPG